MRACILFLAVIVPMCWGMGPDVLKQLESQMADAKEAQALAGFSDSMLQRVEDKPKEIHISCPGDVSPVVSIKDLIQDNTSAFDESECMVLKLTGKNFNFRLSVNCQDADSMDMTFDDERDDERKEKEVKKKKMDDLDNLDDWI